MRQGAASKPAVITVDLGLPPHTDTAEEGLELLRELLAADALAKVIVITGSNDRGNALKALRLGAFDYLLKPVDLDQLRVVLQRATYLAEIDAELRWTGDGETQASWFEDILGATPKMREVFDTLTQVAKTDATVLVQGESGTGKELAARAIHTRSGRARGPFVAINCGAIPETLLESELFGSERGAYTGAHMQRKGKLELAHGGTLFLDEIGEMSLGLQVKLLRFLQERRLERVGGRTPITVDTRVIAATNKDLKTEIGAARFREDVYYRISVVVVTMPPLRERSEDIVLLANSFLRRSCEQQRRKLRFSLSAIEAITRHRWPGNIRGLENAVERAAIGGQRRRGGRRGERPRERNAAVTRRFLVTGGAGFIGSHVVERLLADGHDVRVLDNLSSGSLDNLAFAGTHGALEVIRGDIRDLSCVEAAAAGVEVIFHQAALRSVPQSV